MKINIDLEYFQDNNIKYLAGVDEAGRGSLCGPIIVAAIILPSDYINYEINDSKLLSAKKRFKLYNVLLDVALSYAVIKISVKDVEQYNPKKASIMGMEAAISSLTLTPDFVLTDAEKLNNKYQHKAVIKGDQKSQSIAAASIIAKVYRDILMIKYDQEYPGYNLKSNKGYGTKEHLLALNKIGASPIHRKTYAPVKNLCKK